MTEAQLIVTTLDAPWLPSGSTAEVWAGDDCSLPEPAVIVRLLLTRTAGASEPEFFCVETVKGMDLPTRFLGPADARERPAYGIARLAEDVFGRPDVTTRCIGYVRNVVPRPDASYPHPTPYAHVLVLLATQAAEPVVAGDWVTLERGRAELTTRHWWPIVDHHLAGQP
ncbi:NUDIX hydrolase [Luteipulveratus flavus]|uniref:NUDIX hydrolase n=1 Tax=Luteipulveratus flavus TaxID=3031728 RepID=A0ABT6C2J0_9MICO|nr:NUDIX hydrolase [Luteipulveratus sp. YIM 133296]MDF8262958.1 NUDIX hydrolase [Luteipulveratus sp. YIM 133296]